MIEMLDMFDVLMTLLQQSNDSPQAKLECNEKLQQQLEQIGLFDHINTLDKALVVNDSNHDSMRVFLPREIDKLSSNCCSLLIFLERAGIIDGVQREDIINTLFFLPVTQVDMKDFMGVLILQLLCEPKKILALLMLHEFLSVQKTQLH